MSVKRINQNTNDNIQSNDFKNKIKRSEKIKENTRRLLLEKFPNISKSQQTVISADMYENESTVNDELSSSIGNLNRYSCFIYSNLLMTYI